MTKQEVLQGALDLKANIISEEIAKNILHDCGSIRRMLITFINTAKENTK